MDVSAKQARQVELMQILTILPVWAETQRCWIVDELMRAVGYSGAYVCSRCKKEIR